MDTSAIIEQRENSIAVDSADKKTNVQMQLQEIFDTSINKFEAESQDLVDLRKPKKRNESGTEGELDEQIISKKPPQSFMKSSTRIKAKHEQQLIEEDEGQQITFRQSHDNNVPDPIPE